MSFNIDLEIGETLPRPRKNLAYFRVTQCLISVRNEAIGISVYLSVDGIGKSNRSFGAYCSGKNAIDLLDSMIANAELINDDVIYNDQRLEKYTRSELDSLFSKFINDTFGSNL